MKLIHYFKTFFQVIENRDTSYTLSHVFVIRIHLHHFVVEVFRKDMVENIQFHLDSPFRLKLLSEFNISSKPTTNWGILFSISGFEIRLCPAVRHCFLKRRARTLSSLPRGATLTDMGLKRILCQKQFEPFFYLFQMGIHQLYGLMEVSFHNSVQNPLVKFLGMS